MSSSTWERLVALVPPPSQSEAGRQIETATGTVLQVKSFLTQEGALSLLGSVGRPPYACEQTEGFLYSPVTLHDT